MQTPSEDDAKRAAAFFSLLENLKTTKRTGWVRKGVVAPESIADHMYRMSIMAFFGGGSGGLDQSRCIKLAIMHDVAEAIVGDITPHDPVSKEEKYERELSAVSHMQRVLGEGLWASCAAEMVQLWQEYEAGTTQEALFVKDLDKLEMILQAQEYERSQGIALEEFFTSTEGHFQTPLGKALAKEVIARRAPPALDLGPQGPGSIGKSAAAIAAAQAQAAAAAEAAAAAAAMAGRAGEADAVAVAPKIDSGAGGL